MAMSAERHRLERPRHPAASLTLTPARNVDMLKFLRLMSPADRLPIVP